MRAETPYSSEIMRMMRWLVPLFSYQNYGIHFHYV